MSFEDAVRPAKDGVAIDFEVSPGSKTAKVPSGYNEWRKRIEVRLQSPPEKGKANEELIGLLAALLDVPGKNIEITSGAKDSKKTVKVRGKSVEDMIEKLRGSF